MRVLMMHGMGGSISHWRMGMAVRGLEAQGIECDYHPGLPDEIGAWLYDNAKNYDLIHTGFFGAESTVTAFAAAREYAAVPWITDIDDDYTRVPEYNVAHGYYAGASKGRRTVRMQLRISDAVTTTKAHLAEVLKPDCQRAHVIPNYTNPRDWEDVCSGPEHDDVRIMFAGNIGRYADISTVREALESTLRTHDNVRLFFMGCVPDWALEWMQSMDDAGKNRAFIVRSAGIDDYRRILAYVRPDVFLGPVVENEFNKSKSHIKAYDAAMCGAAFVCTDWPTYEDVPADVAVKVRGAQEWTYALDELVKDAALRQKLNHKLRLWAGKWNVDNHIHRWVDLYKEVVAAGPVRDLSQIVRPKDVDDGLDRPNDGHTSKLTDESAPSLRSAE